MTKKLITSGIVMGTMLMFTGCGGSSSTQSTVTKGTAYYVDSAVQGVTYSCRGETGVTGEKGAFTFEAGANCSFSLGDIALRTVDASLLVNNSTIYETDVNRALILQSLDSDTDPSNGIVIKENMITALETAMKTLDIPMEIPKTSTAMDYMLQAIDMAGGSVITLEKAARHMLITALAGKTFYNVGQDIDNPQDIWGGEVTFNADLTSMSYTDMYGSDAGETGVESIHFDDEKLIFGNTMDGSYTKIGEFKGEYLEIADYNSFNKVESHGRLYFDKAKADAYYKSL